MSGASNKGDTAGVASLIQKSKDNWDLSGELRHKQLYDAAANRLYYSLFQAVKAYAVKTGKMSLDDKEKVHLTAEGIVSAENGDLTTYHCALRLRVLADYWPGHPTASDFVQDFLAKADSLRLHYTKEAKA